MMGGNSVHSEKEYTSENATIKKLKLKSVEAISFLKKNEYNQSVCFFIDMTLPSGQNRFFVYDIVKDTIQNSGLVTHGRCNQMWLEGRRYSNEPVVVAVLWVNIKSATLTMERSD